MYRVFNTPSSLEALRTQLLNYYPGPVVDTLIEDYHNGRVDLATLGEDPDPDVEELKRLYGRIGAKLSREAMIAMINILPVSLYSL